MGTFRNLMIIFGMLFCVLVLVFAIGMFFPGFRNGFYNFLNVVPKSSIVETIPNNEEENTETIEQGTTVNQNSSDNFVCNYKIDVV